MNLSKIVEVGLLDNLVHADNGKVFLHDDLGLTSCEISMNAVPEGWKAPFIHSHKQNEEIYIFLKGVGKVMLDGQSFDVKEGSCLRVAPSVKRTLENTGHGELRFLCIQAKEGSLEQFAMTDGELG